ncbi:FtsX-like permease family protein [Gorillibacterium sp. CAU 1737]|uniref:ABC transporter permease n=1 Tax=Gorillibacterium sp. CAU 1737 TaxID=3140362 RepID=UPI003261151A
MNRYTQLTGKYIRGQKKRSILTIFGIILSVTLLTSVATIGMSYRDKVIRQTVQSFGDYHVSFNGMEGDAVANIQQQAAVQAAGVISREGYAVIQKTSEKERSENPFASAYRYLNVKGYDEEAMRMLQVQVEEGRLPQASDEIILSSWGLSSFATKPKLGDRVSLTLGIRKVASTGEIRPISGMGDFGWGVDEAFEGQTKREFTVVGFMKPASNQSWSSSFIYPAITFNDHKTIDKNRTYFVYVQMKSLDRIKDKTESILTSLHLQSTEQGSALELNRESTVKSVRVEYNNELLKLYGKSTYGSVNASTSLAFAAIVVIILLSTIAVIYNTFHISVLERMSQFGILRCIGATPAQIRKIVMREAVLLSVFGIPIGLLLGTLFMKALFYSISFLSLGFLNDMRMVVSPLVLLGAAALGFITVIFSATGPARQAASVTPLEAVKSTGTTKVEPVTSVKKSDWVKWIFGIEGQFARRNLQRNKRRFRITAFSMIISLVLLIVFSGLVDLLRQQASQSGIRYSYSLQYEGSSKQIDPTVFEEIVKLDAVKQAYPFSNEQVMAIIPKDKVNPTYYELMSDMFVVETEQGYRMSNNFLQSFGENGLDDLKPKLTSGAIDKEQMNRKNGVILIQKISMMTESGKRLILDQTHFQVGDEIQIRTMNGNGQGYQTVTVMGIADQGPLSTGYSESAVLGMVTTPEVMAKISGSDAYSRIFIQAKSDQPDDSILNYLQTLVQKDAGYNYMDRVSELLQAKNDAMTASIFFYGFIGVIILIAFLNIINTVSTNLILRTKEFAVLKAIGMTQRDVSKMILLEGLFYGLFSGISGILIGAALSYGIQFLYQNTLDTAWGIPWTSMGLALFGALFTTFLATMLPMRRLNRVPIVQALRAEE